MLGLLDWGKDVAEFRLEAWHLRILWGLELGVWSILPSRPLRERRRRATILKLSPRLPGIWSTGTLCSEKTLNITEKHYENLALPFARSGAPRRHPHPQR